MRMLVGKSAGGFSGGTIASLMGAMFDETSEELKLAADPYALNPPNAHRYREPYQFALQCGKWQQCMRDLVDVSTHGLDIVCL